MKWSISVAADAVEAVGQLLHCAGEYVEEEEAIRRLLFLVDHPEEAAEEVCSFL